MAVCPPEHRHADTHTCYNAHKCRCAPCRRAKSRRRNRYDRRARELAGRDVWVPALGTVRRLRSLAVIGWSIDEVAGRAGLFHRSLLKVRSGERREVRASTWRAVKRVYEQVECHPRNNRAGKITRTLALAQGWLSPAEWDDPDRDHVKHRETA